MGYCAVTLLTLLAVRMRVVRGVCDYVPCVSGAPHSMCLYPAKLDTTAPLCNGPDALAGLEDRNRREILHRHNLLRQRVAQGKVRGQPPAANMMELSWNAEVEIIAQRFANECGKDGLVNDQCRDLKDGTPAGQNAYVGSLTIQQAVVQDKSPYIAQMMKTWFDESEYLNASLIQYYNSTDALRVYHYTQVVWAETTLLGCGAVLQNKVSDTEQPMMIKCNYATTGNVEGAEVYHQGKACSECPEGSHCSMQYEGLCTDVTAETKTQTKAAATTTNMTITINIVLCCLVMITLYNCKP